MWGLKYGSAIFVAGAGNREVARCAGGHISWQAQYFLRALEVWAWERSWQVVEVEWRCDIGIGV